MYELLKEKNLKITDQRKRVIDLIKTLDHEATIANIALGCENEVDYSTVHRILNLFIEKQLIEKKLNYKDEIIYSLKEEHGHYFNCVKCHTKEKLEACPLISIDHNLEEQKGYQILSHTIEVYGICATCLKRKTETHEE